MPVLKSDVLNVLSSAVVDGNTVKIVEKLERKMYLEVNKVLEALGGKWARGMQAHVFETDDVGDKLEAVVLAGGYDKLLKDIKKLGFFPTPPELAKRVVELARIKREMKVLEPSAGTGNLAFECLKYTPYVTCVEIDQDRVRELKSRFMGKVGLAVTCKDFMTLSELTKFDCIVMNPPFEKQQDIDHVLHAIKFLKPGGRLAAIMSAGVKYRTNKKTVNFRMLTGLQIFDNPENAFKASGTNVNTVTVTYDKPEA